eukprot:7624067-Karenia_brevis.AAC.1
MCKNSKCKLRHKLNYTIRKGCKMNTLTNVDGNPIMLVHAQLGFTYRYLVQLWHRMCRTGTSTGGEAATILLTYPNAKVGCTAKGGAGNQGLTEKHLQSLLMKGVLCLLRLQEGVTDFDVNDPVPRKDPDFDTPSRGLCTIFNAAKHDPSFDTSRTTFD